MTARDHNKLLGIFFFVQGGLGLFGGIIALTVYGGMGAYMMLGVPERETQFVGSVFLAVAIVVGLIFAAIAIFNFVTGWKLVRESGSARLFGIIASILCIPSFPLGTALGVYGLWFFFGVEGKQFYDGRTSAHPPPPPNSWQ